MYMALSICAIQGLCDAGRKPAVSFQEGIHHLPKPAWWTGEYDRYAQSTRILKPWTPLRYGAKEVSVWGRTLRWGRSLLPDQIISQKVPLLIRPIEVVVRMAGRSYSVPLENFAFTRKMPHKGFIRTKGSVKGLTFIANMWIEYDGFLWVDLRLSGKNREIESLHIVAPLDAGHVRLYQTFNRSLAGWIPRKPLHIPWLANPGENIVDFYHWFGEEDRGLGFTYTTDQHWHPASMNNFCTLVPGAKEHLYTMNLVEKPVKAHPLRYLFGIQATPLKPLPPDYHSMVGSSLLYGPWRAWEQMPENMDIVLIWAEATGTMRGLNDPYNISPTFSEVIQYPHSKGVAATGPASCPQKISPYSAEFQEHKDEWEVLPESLLNWNNVPHYQNCGRSESLRRWLFNAWAQNIRKFKMDGIYFDGWQTGQIACANPRHGCGWTDAQGKRHVTVPVLEGREFNKALALFMEDHIQSPYIPPRTAPERKGFPRYHYWIHSWEFVPSVTGFATCFLTGEFTGYPQHGPGMLTPEGTYGKCMDLGFFRARSLSTHWGVVNLFDPLMWEADEHPKTDRQTLMAFAWFLPHGVPPGLIEYMNHNTAMQIYGILQKFQTRKARFTPAWRRNPYFEIASPLLPEVMVATWDHNSEDKVLAVVSNLQADKEARIALRWKGFADPSMTDAMTGKPLALTDGKLELKLLPESFGLLWVER